MMNEGVYILDLTLKLLGSDGGLGLLMDGVLEKSLMITDTPDGGPCFVDQ